MKKNVRFNVVKNSFLRRNTVVSTKKSRSTIIAVRTQIEYLYLRIIIYRKLAVFFQLVIAYQRKIAKNFPWKNLSRADLENGKAINRTGVFREQENTREEMSMS